MSVRVVAIDLNVLDMQTRIPFRYGIAELRALPHLFVRVTCEVDGAKAVGLAADGLPPKWFTKNPTSDLKADLLEMIDVIRAACDEALRIGDQPSVFDWWRKLFDAQSAWGTSRGMPALLWNFGVSLVERAVIDAFCRLRGVNFSQAVRKNLLGIRLDSIYPELTGKTPAQLLPEKPVREMILRHTVGLADPLTDADIPAGERLDDGLPQSLEANIRAYGLTYFKLKLFGKLSADLDRLHQLQRIIEAGVGGNKYAFTLDGNEQFQTLDAFRATWDAIAADATLRRFMDHLIFAEQPLHRDVALSDATQQAMLAWPERPPTIIDESDGDLTSLRRGLECGYVGASHKNCKGVFKGLANACYLEHLRRANPGQRYEMSGEDLASVGPVSMVADVAVAANLGIGHIERNGHHYFAGLSMYPADIQEEVLGAHGDLYRRHERGFATLKVERGKIEIGSVVDAPLGTAPLLETLRFTPLSQWSM